MSRKPEAFLFVENNGMYTKHCKDKKTAIKAMQAELDSWGDEWVSEHIGEVTLNEETVQEGIYRQHRACETETIGDDDTCNECGEPCGTVGRKTFTIWF